MTGGKLHIAFMLASLNVGGGERNMLNLARSLIERGRAVASHLGTEHAELYVSARQALDVVPRLPDLFDEPFADPSQIPTFLVAGMARRQVTVALSGDGGDELFGGYDLYSLVPRLWTSWRRRRLFDVPLPLRRLGEGAILALAAGSGTALGERLLRRLPPSTVGAGRPTGSASWRQWPPPGHGKSSTGGAARSGRTRTRSCVERPCPEPSWTNRQAVRARWNSRSG